MRPIKFRGRDIDTGDFVYGHFAENADGDSLITKDFNVGYQVDPDSVAQFVGYDKNGAEVYEGDLLVDKHGIGYVVRLIPQVPVAKMTVKEDEQ